MAFIRCPKCNCIIDSDRKACPFCGCPINEKAEDENPNFPFEDNNESKEEVVEENVIEESVEEIKETQIVEPTPIVEEKKAENVSTPVQQNTSSFSNNLQTSSWITEWQNKPKKNRIIAFIFFAIFFALFIVFLSLFNSSKEVIHHDYGYGITWDETVEDFDYLMTAMWFGFGALTAFIFLIASFCSFVEVRNVKGYDVVIYGYCSYKLIIEGQEVDRAYSRGNRYSLFPTIKLSGRLPDHTLIVVTIQGSFGHDIYLEVGN